VIQLFENCLSKTDLGILQRRLSEPHWGFGFISTDPNRPIWNFDKQEGADIAQMVMQAVPKEFELSDYHINGQTFGQDGAPHRDVQPNTTHAFVYFPQQWDYTYGGRLIIAANDIAHSILPRQNLGVLFPADLVHHAEGPSTYAANRLRVSVGLKLRKK
jgi:hypothetical protein